MLNKTNIKKKIPQSYTKRISNIILFLIITVPIVFCAFTIIVPELTTYATPTSGGSSTISLSVTDPVVNFHFTSSENSSSVFKQATTSISYSSGNQTGVSIYASSIDENTSLKTFSVFNFRRDCLHLSTTVWRNFKSKNLGISHL